MLTTKILTLTFLGCIGSILASCSSSGNGTYAGIKSGSDVAKLAFSRNKKKSKAQRVQLWHARTFKQNSVPGFYVNGQLVLKFSQKPKLSGKTIFFDRFILLDHATLLSGIEQSLGRKEVQAKRTLYQPIKDSHWDVVLRDNHVYSIEQIQISRLRKTNFVKFKWRYKNTLTKK